MMHASDATFPSLILGIGLGLSITFLSYLGWTQPHLLTLFIQKCGTMQILAGLLFLTLAVVFVKIACIKTRTANKLKTEDRLAALKRNTAHLPAHFPNGWYKLCDSADLPIGATKHIALLNKNVAIFRAAGEKNTGAGRGIVHAVDAICPHLGANLGEGGKVEENRIVCPFHGWQFEGKTGVCTKIPYATKIPATAKTGTWQICEVNQEIYLWYHVEFISPNWSIPNVLASADAAVDVTAKNRLSLTHHGKIVQDVAGNIQEVVNKYADYLSGDLISSPPSPSNSAAKDDRSSSLQQQTPPSPPTPSSFLGFSWKWIDGRSRNWITSATPSKPSSSSSSTSPPPPQHEMTLLASCRLQFLSYTVPFTHFIFDTHLYGPSLFYTTIRASTPIVRFLMGKLLLRMEIIPENVSMNQIEISIASEANDKNPVKSFASTILCFPIRRFMSKIFLHLYSYQVQSILPVVRLKKVKLSLNNEDGNGKEDVWKKDDGEDETATNNASIQPTPDSPSTATDASGVKKRNFYSSSSSSQGYTSTSLFYSTYWRDLYSTATKAKKQDGMDW